MGRKEDVQLFDLMLDRLGERLLKAAGANNSDAEDDARETNGIARKGRRKKKKRGRAGYTLPRSVSEESILSLVKEKGPMRVKQIEELTGLTQSAAHKKIAVLRDSGALKQVREGTTVLYMAPPHGGRGRKTIPRKKKRAVRKVTPKKSTSSSAASS